MIIYILVILVAICAALITILKLQKRSMSVRMERNQLKENGQKIRVDFEQCEIKTRENLQENSPDSFPARDEMLDALYDQNRNYRRADVIESGLVYKYKYRNQVIHFNSEMLHMPVVTLRFRLDQQKYTFIYYDPDNLTKYFFDLDFLGTSQIPNEY